MERNHTRDAGDSARRAESVLTRLFPARRTSAAALAFARSRQFAARELEIAGGELTTSQAADVFARVLGRPVKFRRLRKPVVKMSMSKEFYQMFGWFNAGGDQADIATVRRDYPAIQLMSLEDLLHSEGWENKRTITVKHDKIGRPLPVN